MVPAGTRLDELLPERVLGHGTGGRRTTSAPWLKIKNATTRRRGWWERFGLVVARAVEGASAQRHRRLRWQQVCIHSPFPLPSIKEDDMAERNDEVLVQLATRIPKTLHRQLKLYCVE